MLWLCIIVIVWKICVEFYSTTKLSSSQLGYGELKMSSKAIYNMVNTVIYQPQSRYDSYRNRNQSFGHSNGKRAVFDRDGNVLGMVPMGRGIGSKDVVGNIRTVLKKQTTKVSSSWRIMSDAQI